MTIARDDHERKLMLFAISNFDSDVNDPSYFDTLSCLHAQLVPRAFHAWTLIFSPVFAKRLFANY